MSETQQAKPAVKPAKRQLALVLSEAQLEKLTNGERITVKLDEIELTVKVDYTAPAFAVGMI